VLISLLSHVLSAVSGVFMFILRRFGAVHGSEDVLLASDRMLEAPVTLTHNHEPTHLDPIIP
jgi:hypothetical protein